MHGETSAVDIRQSGAVDSGRECSSVHLSFETKITVNAVV